MQRFAGRIIPPVANGLGLGGGGSLRPGQTATQNVSSSPPPRNAGCFEEDEWEVLASDLSTRPITQREVSHVLGEVTHTTSLHAAAFYSSDSESDVSDGTSADRLMAYADQPASIMDSLSTIVSNLLAQPDVGPQVTAAVMADPEFRRLVERHNIAETVGLPAPARAALALPGPEGWVPGAVRNEPLLNPFEEVIMGAMRAVGDAISAFGNLLRRLGDDVRIVLMGLGGRRGALTTPDGRTNSHFEAALMRVVTGVAVAVLLRRAVMHP